MHLVMIGTDCTGSCKSNYHMIMTMTAPSYYEDNEVRPYLHVGHIVNIRKFTTPYVNFVSVNVLTFYILL
jgi:hypothetical protein